jgi:hypothetical protein
VRLGAGFRWKGFGFGFWGGSQDRPASGSTSRALLSAFRLLSFIVHCGSSSAFFFLNEEPQATRGAWKRGCYNRVPRTGLLIEGRLLLLLLLMSEAATTTLLLLIEDRRAYIATADRR